MTYGMPCRGTLREPITALKTAGRGARSLVGCHQAGAIDPFCETIVHMVQGARIGAQRQR